MSSLRLREHPVDAAVSAPAWLPATTEQGDANTSFGLTGYELHRVGLFKAAERAYCEAIRLSPGNAETWSNLGLALQAQRRFDEAEACQHQALRLAPAYPEAHNNLGLAHYEQGRVAEAENSFRGALRLQPDYPNALTNLGIALQSLNRLDEAEACYRRALAVGAEPARVLNNLGLLLQERGRPEAAEAACRTALAHGPAQPDARTNLALVLLLRGAYAEGWDAYEARWQTAAMAAAAPRLTCPQWTGVESLAGRSILLHAEQGFGDALQFCRYASPVARAGARVLLQAPPALCRLLTSLDGVGAVITAGAPLPAFDLHCPLMSLPRAFRTTLATVPADVPYLRADPTAVRGWRRQLGDLPGPRIGLVWAGGERADQPHAAAIDRRRSIALAALAPLAEVGGCSFISLQLGPAAGQARPTGVVLHDPTAALGDFADTAALIEALDLVIAVDTAVAHLAAALGKPVWLLNRFDTCWRWGLGRADSAWYPTLRQFRQPAPGDWMTPIARVAAELVRLADGDASVLRPDGWCASRDGAPRTTAAMSTRPVVQGRTDR